MAKFHVAVTGLNTGESPCPGVGVIRSLKQATGDEVRIIGLTYELLNGASYVDHLVDEVYSVPFPQNDEEKYLKRIKEIAKKTKINVFIPSLDFEIAPLSNLESALKDLGIRLLLPSETTVSLCKKERLPRLSELTGIDVPFTVILRDRREIVTSASYFAYPFVIKAAAGDGCIVYTLEEAIVFSNRLSAHWGWPLIMQSYIKGDEFSVAALADQKHEVVGSVCMKKILKSKNGNTWIGSSAKDENLIKLTQKVIKKVKWEGPMEIEFIKDPDSRRYFLIEINPRFPSWIELVAKAGCNLPMALVKTAFSQKVKPFSSYRSGILFARSGMYTTCDVTRLGQLATKEEIIYNGHNHSKN